MNKHKSLAAASLAMLLLAACSSGGLGDIFGGGPSSQPQEIRGTVESVDTSTSSIYLTNVSGYQSMLSNSGSNSSVRVYFDNQTTVDYQGTSYRPQDLERGDEVSVRVDENGSRLVADSMTVLHDVSSGSSSGSYTTNVSGTVRYVDPSRRTIEITRSNGATSIIEFDTSTPVTYGNQSVRVADLERGDEINVRVRDLGNNRFVAQDITVTRSVSGGTSSGSSQLSTVRGTVRYVDTSRHTIELESTSWISGFGNSFNSGSGSGSGGTIIVQYGTNVGVEVAGRVQPITGLERGDVIDVQVRKLGSSSYTAERVLLVRDVNR